MIIRSNDLERTLSVGTSDVLYSLYSTITIRLDSTSDNYSLAISFLKNGTCGWEDALECAKQFNLIRDALSCIKPEDAIYDMKDLSKKAPWKSRISPIVTSCSNMYTTSDGKDLLSEIVYLLCYSYYKKVSISIE